MKNIDETTIRKAISQLGSINCLPTCHRAT